MLVSVLVPRPMAGTGPALGQHQLILPRSKLALQNFALAPLDVCPDAIPSASPTTV